MSRKILKTYPHLEELDNYALKIMNLVDKTYPAWAGYAQVGEFEGEKFLEIKIPGLYKSTGRELSITTANDDLTVYLNMYHVHFGRFFKTPEEAFEHAKVYIDGIT
ncbi:MAG TPA: hypothetical protein VHO69_19375 [Phototrophicaceae bacterium]|nr:hypothetical protein [Phototrophicaceae bacterium]